MPFECCSRHRYPTDGRGRGGGGGGRGTGAARGGARQAASRWGSKRWGQQTAEAKLPSIEIKESYRMVATIELSDLNKIGMRPPTGTTLVTAGKAEKYNDRVFDGVTPRFCR